MVGGTDKFGARSAYSRRRVQYNDYVDKGKSISRFIQGNYLRSVEPDHVGKSVVTRSTAASAFANVVSLQAPESLSVSSNPHRLVAAKPPRMRRL